MATAPIGMVSRGCASDAPVVAGLRVPIRGGLEGGHVETALGELALTADL